MYFVFGTEEGQDREREGDLWMHHADSVYMINATVFFSSVISTRLIISIHPSGSHNFLGHATRESWI